MFFVGSRVRVIDGEHHGKTGEIVDIVSELSEDGSYTVSPEVALSTDVTVIIAGNLLELTR